MIYVVIGMHKSGTTLISRILHQSGIDMGKFSDEISYDKGNKYERHETQSINYRILGCGNAHSLDVITPVSNLPTDSSIPADINAFVSQANALYDSWGFKDPRTCLTYPVWQKYLPAHKVIFIYRRPLELWHHYRKYIPRRKFILRTIHGYKALRAWYIHNHFFINYLAMQNNMHLINFSEFMSSTLNFEQLCQFTGTTLKDCRDSNLYRSKPEPDLIYKICTAVLRAKHAPHVERIFRFLDDTRESQLYA